MTQCNAVQHQPLASNLNLAVAAPSSHYNPYVAAPCENYRRIIPYANGVGGSFKRKNTEGVTGNYYYHNALAWPSSFLSLVKSRLSESNAASFLPPEDAANMNGHYVEAGNIGVQGYQMTTTNIGSSGFLHSSMAQGATPIFIILLHLCKGSEVIIITFCPKWLHRHVEHQQSVLHIPASMHSRTLQMLGLHL
ncbi:uncharacterized protein LOC111402541 [Olea europaea var. sylvestris]|uniref:uncharacterized protein LOC111402541 n=1 Tax=Olea europaea var. sylvestris TaxID=158386 RepID=UPI000C1D205B|nr:uncharacterized protein LOC111402541 [Olea europaea var. sylvestris]XP_022886686.1 uncharacterized protein LOC111402541 [Olea europaea var. sylvestris]XP_022886687.1 uncharacterized protein LOC111402541 [Olea europaea var. sylvestris]XP_022886688.1 uncharacterized protein LOC111402541 [Olea europaea var. sylvestris]XP_022886689.1 uncharacterized protein LOC111402541 [Olea europaea var. sylvestris]